MLYQNYSDATDLRVGEISNSQSSYVTVNTRTTIVAHNIIRRDGDMCSLVCSQQYFKMAWSPELSLLSNEIGSCQGDKRYGE